MFGAARRVRGTCTYDWRRLAVAPLTRHTAPALDKACGTSSMQQWAKPILTGVCLSCAGDLAAQYVGDAKELDTPRLLFGAALGAGWMGVAIPTAYSWMESVFPGSGFRAVLGKVGLSCSLVSTFGNYATLFLRRSFNTYGTDVEACCASCNEDIVEVFLADVSVWPAVDVLCFTMLSPQARSVFVSAVSACWFTYVSIVAARSAPPPGGGAGGGAAASRRRSGVPNPDYLGPGLVPRMVAHF